MEFDHRLAYYIVYDIYISLIYADTFLLFKRRKKFEMVTWKFETI